MPIHRALKNSPQRPRTGGRAVAARTVVVLTALVLTLAPITAAAASRRAAPKDWDERLVPLAATVEELRGLEFERPVAVEFLGEAAFERRVAVDRGKLTAADKEDIARSEAQLRAVGLVPADIDIVDAVSDLQQSGVLAYYDPKKDRITVRGTKLDLPIAVTLAHELTHALQDQHFDLEAMQRTARKRHGSSALQAIVEGDADRIENAYVEGLGGDDRAAYRTWQATAGAGVQEELDAKAVPDVLVAIFQSPYLLGPPLLSLVMTANGEQGIDDLFRAPPAADSAYLSPLTVLDGRAPLRVATPALADGERRQGKPDVFGAFGLYLMLATGGDPAAALRVADGWGGDAMVTFTRGDTTCLRAAFRGRDAPAGDAIRDALQEWAVGHAGEVEVIDGTSTLTACDPGDAAVDPGDTARAALVTALIRNTLLAQGAEQVGVDVAACMVDDVLDDPAFAPVLVGAVDEPNAQPPDAVLERFQTRFREIGVSCAGKS